MAQTKEISKDLRRRLLDAHQAGKGYKTIFEEFGLHQSTVRQIVYKWKTSNTIVTLPRSGQTTKTTPRARHVIFWEATRDPRVMSKKLKASCAVATVSVHESTIRRTGVARKKGTSLQNERCCCLRFAQDHMDKPEGD